METTLLRSGLIVDGRAGPAFEGHVHFRGERIEAVLTAGETTPKAAREIDVAGKVIAPGFIDMHSHADWQLPLDNHPLLSPDHPRGTQRSGVAGDARSRAAHWCEAAALALHFRRPPELAERGALPRNGGSRAQRRSRHHDRRLPVHLRQHDDPCPVSILVPRITSRGLPEPYRPSAAACRAGTGFRRAPQSRRALNLSSHPGSARA